MESIDGITPVSAPVVGIVSERPFRRTAERSFREHVDDLFACRRCPRVFGAPVSGPVWGARVMLIGQAPGSREIEEHRPFAYTAGRTLFRWFADVGADEQTIRSHVHMAAVIRCFPGKAGKGGGDRVPDREEIARCSSHLDREIRLLRPELVILVGTLAAAQTLGTFSLASIVGLQHRASRAGVEFDAVVLPHPSGRSTWLNLPANGSLLDRSLNLIGQHPAFRESVLKESP